MEKFMRVLAIALCFAFCVQVSALAVDQSTATVVGTAGVTAAMAAENAYETSVVARVVGRAGSATQRGAKGNIFEVLAMDQLNFFNTSKGTTTVLSASSIDDFADLVTVNSKTGEISRSFQCKAGTSPSHITQTIRQVASDKYAGAELIGTTEFAMLYNEDATTKGISQLATDSGISTNTASRFTDRALCNAQPFSQVASQAMKLGGIAVGVTSIASTAESIILGHDIYELVGNVVENSSVSGLSVALGVITTAEMPAALAALGLSATAASAATTVIGFLVPAAAGYILYVLAEECQLEESVAKTTEQIASMIGGVVSDIKVTVTEWNIPERASNLWSSAVDDGAVAVEAVATFGENAWGHITNAANSVAETVSDVFSAESDPNTL